MNIGLIGPTDMSVTSNPGWHMITGGIRYLLREAHPDVVFLPMNMGGVDDSWLAARSCQAVVLCGNPRFTMSTGNAFWENAIWDNLLRLQEEFGVKVIDGWAGSAFPVNAYNPTPDEMALAIAFFPGRQHRLSQAAKIHGRITRDITMQKIYERAGVTSTLSPCSSWWAKNEFKWKSPISRGYDVLVVYRLEGQEELMRTLAHGRRVVAVTWQDFEWCNQHGIKGELVTDPSSLLTLFAGAQNVLSFRLHCAVPAASVGANVVAAAIDSRADACQLFDIPVVRFDQLFDTKLEFKPAKPADEVEAIELLRGMLC